VASILAKNMHKEDGLALEYKEVDWSLGLLPDK
jgi:hypothetical protein